MAETQSTTTTTTATAPTGDIKVFIDAFNKDFDAHLKSLLDAQQNYKNVYADAIKITTPKNGPWPNDPNVVTIGDLFRYTFPDIESDKIIEPPEWRSGDGPESDKLINSKGWLNDLKNSKDEKIKKMYSTISNGIRSTKDMKKYQDLKKPGITNPSLWSPGQYYFDVFMEKFFVSRETKPSSFLKDPYQSNIDDSTKNDFVEFADAIYSLSNIVVYTTGINISLKGNEDKSSLFPSLQTQYKSGLWSELVPKKNVDDQFYKDKDFDSRRGDFDSGLPKTFIGYYEHILLYKAFIQAGDNYKSIVLPVGNSEPSTTTPNPNPPLVKVLPKEVGYTFNVEKKDSFVIVGGSMSGTEFTIVPNDGTTYIVNEAPINNLDDEDMLDDEYSEGEYQGSEQDLFILDTSGYTSIDIDSINSIKGFNPDSPNEALSTDSTNKYPVSKDKEANIKAIIKAAKALGVTNKFAITAILAIVSKESGFVPRSEASYATTSGARIMKIFGSKGYTAAEWDVIKKDAVRFFDLIYGGKYGNSTTEGYKYRGRGFNQITFKGNYSQYAKETGVDIVNDPDLLNTVDVAAKCVVAYFKRNIKNAPASIRSQYHFTDINSFTNLNDATGAIYHANAGWGKSYSEIVADSTGGRKKAFANAGPLYNSYQSQIA